MTVVAGLVALVLALNYLWWIVAALLVAMAVHVLRSLRDTALEQRELARRMGVVVAARADEENAAVLAGDDRGVYGKYPPCLPLPDHTG
jgi:hypothetical protein